MRLARSSISRRPTRYGQPPRRCTARFITPDQARRIAVYHLDDKCYAHGHVLDLQQAKLWLYRPPSDESWVVYRAQSQLGDDGQLWLTSSDFVIVSKRTGKILYAGSAHDEG